MINYLLLSLAAAFGWGLSPIFARVVLQYYDNVTFVIARALIIGILCLIYILFNTKNIQKNIYNTKGHIKLKPLLYVVLGSMVTFIGSICYFTAMYKSSRNTILISLISYILPLLLISIASYIFFEDKINSKMILGMIITIIGLSMVVYYNPNKS